MNGKMHICVAYDPNNTGYTGQQPSYFVLTDGQQTEPLAMEQQPDHGTMALALLGDSKGVFADADLPVRTLPIPLFEPHDRRGEASRDFGERLIGDRWVPLISATGRCRKGRRIGEVVSQRLGRSLLELGGNNAVLILDDANLDLALRAVLFGAVGTAGQRCTSTRRLILQRGIADRFLDRLVRAYGSVRIGDPLDPQTLMGPLVNAAAVRDMMAAIEAAKAGGGEILCGGHRVDRQGYFVEPTIVRAPRDLGIAREETFGPVAPVIPFETEEEAIRLANATPYGLAAYFYSGDVARIFRVAEKLEFGMVGVNESLISTEVAPFGGVKQSGLGREGSRYGLDDYLEIKYVCLGGMS